MRVLKQNRSFALVAFGMTALLTGCLGKGGAVQGPGGGADDSILATIGGISDQDMAEAEFTFFLTCAQVRVKGEPVSANGKDMVRFPGDQVKDNDLCSMQIESEKWMNDNTYKWYGVRDGKKVKGLAYASDEQKVTTRKLALTLYKLYSKGEGFSLTVDVEFEDQAAKPASGSASLVCGAQESYPGKYTPRPDSKDATLSFELPVSEFKDKACAEVVVLADDKKFAGEAKDLVIKDANATTKAKFPIEDGKRYILRYVPAATGGSIDVSADTKECVHFDATSNKCLDVGSRKLPWDKNVILAKVVGRLENGAGEVATYYVAAYEKGLGALVSKELRVSEMQKSLAADASVEFRKRFNWYNDSLDAEELLKQEFDADVMNGNTIAQYKVARTDLVSFKPLHIEELYVHGLRGITAEDLNSKEKVIWITSVKAQKTGQKTIEFLVSGHEKYLRSSAAPTTIDGKPAYFALKDIIEDFQLANGSTRWRAYAGKGSTLAQASCEKTEEELLVKIGTATESGLAATAAADVPSNNANQEKKLARNLDDCEIKQLPTDLLSAGYSIGTTHYVWEWFSLDLEAAN